MHLAAISMQGCKDVEEFIATFTGSHVYIMDYLVSEVLDCQPPAVRDFLLKTCILERLTAPLCNAVTGQMNGQEMLEYLAQANLFLIPLDDQRQWFRYHHLFADLLRSRQKQILGMETWPGMHQRAAAWFAEQHQSSEAIGHIYATGDLMGAPFTIAGVRFPGSNHPILQSVVVLDTSTLATDIDVFIADASMTGTTAVDNGAMVLTDALLASIVGCVSVTTYYQLDDNCVGQAANLALALDPNGSNDLYGFVVCREARTADDDMTIVFNFIPG